MKYFIKRTIDRILRKPLLVKPVVSGSKLCPDCDGKMEYIEVPTELILFRVPFTKIEIISRKWDGKEYYCNDCARDYEQERQHDAFDYGIQEGFNRGYDAAVREHGVYYR